MYWYAGELILNDTIPIQISDPGLLYGATVFTTLRVYDRDLDHPLTHWSLHCDRLHDSLITFDWQLPDWMRLRQGAEMLLKRAEGRKRHEALGTRHEERQKAYLRADGRWQMAEGGMKEGGRLRDDFVLRIAIFPDGREWIVGRALPQDLSERQQQGIIGWVAEGRGKEVDNKLLLKRSLANHKTGNYLSCWLALQKAATFGAKDAILIDEQENWLETSTGNLWGWKAGCWWTPVLEENFLLGIVRSQLIKWLQAQNISVKENQWTPDFVKDLEAIALSNSVVEIVPFSRILTSKGQLSFDPIHPALEKLRSYFEQGNRE